MVQSASSAAVHLRRWTALSGGHGLVSAMTFGPHDRPFFLSFSFRSIASNTSVPMVVPTGSLMLREVFVRPNTRRVDWWMIALLLVALGSFAGATVLWMHSVRTTAAAESGRPDGPRCAVHLHAVHKLPRWLDMPVTRTLD